MADFTTIRVLTKDSHSLIKRYGRPAHEAFSHVLAQCQHPEQERQYTTAYIPNISENQTVAGFYCNACRHYVFPSNSKGK